MVIFSQDIGICDVIKEFVHEDKSYYLIRRHDNKVYTSVVIDEAIDVLHY